MAGVEGIEPPSQVLETRVLPLNYTPMDKETNVRSLRLFMYLVCLAMFAMLFNLQSLSRCLLILSGVIINALAIAAFHLDHVDL